MPVHSRAGWRVGLSRNRGIPLLVLCVVIVAAYFPTFSGEFILDDKPFVKDNPSIQGFHSLASSLFQEDGIVGDQVGRAHSGYYRPLTHMTYNLDFMLWGSRAFGFRATNLALHLLTCVFLYLCLGKILGWGIGPFFAVLFFGLHPANTESVAWVSSRNNILVSLFSMASLYFYVRRGVESKTWQGMLSLACFALALLSKEFAVMLLPIMIMYDRVVCAKERPFRKALTGYLAFSSLIIGYLMLRRSAIHGLFPEYWSIGNLCMAVYFVPFLIMENLRIVLFPFGLHNFMVTYPDSLFGAEAFLGFAGMILMFWLLWRWRAKRIVLFSLLSFLVALFPVLNLFPTSAYSLISMRWLYFPMSFLVFAVAWGLVWIGKGRRRGLGLYLVGVMAVYLGGYTFILNENLWKREEAFFEREVVLFGNDLYAGDLARIHHRKGDYTEAERYYQTAKANRSPDKAGFLISYAGLLIQTKRPEAALALLEKAEKLGPGRKNRSALFNNTGAAYISLKDYGNAVKSFEKATIYESDDLSFLLNLGYAYRQVGENDKAEAVYKRCLRLNADSVDTRIKLGMLYTEKGDFVGARRILEEIPEEVRTGNASIQGMLRHAYEKEGTIPRSQVR